MTAACVVVGWLCGCAFGLRWCRATGRLSPAWLWGVVAGGVAFCVGWTGSPWPALAAVVGAWFGTRAVCVGLTGGIAAGKSTVSHRLAQLGAVVIDADQLARQVVEPGSRAVQSLVYRFGLEVLDVDGGLNRPALRRIISHDSAARSAVNRIIHPAVVWEMMRQVIRHRWLGGRTVVIDSPLLFESGNVLRYLCNPVVVVTTPDDVQLARVCARDGTSKEDAQALIKAQMPQSKKAALADVHLRNDTSVEALLQQVDDLWLRVR